MLHNCSFFDTVRRIGHDLGDYGDGGRKSLRSEFQWKSFQWYLDNICPELFMPGEAVASGDKGKKKLEL